MRKNPYNRDLKDHIPFFMQGPSTKTALVANKVQKDFVEKNMEIPVQNYEVDGVSFNMVRPPLLNQNCTVNPESIINIEMGQTEVTQELFEMVMGWNRSSEKDDPQKPIENVFWYSCIEFCNHLSGLAGLQPCYELTDIIRSFKAEKQITFAVVEWDKSANGFRLPTVDEWLAFARAGTQNRWPGTDDINTLSDYAWWEGNSGRKTHPVGTLRPNEWGLYDMLGNVSEFCWDLYDSDENNDNDERVHLGCSCRTWAADLAIENRGKCLPGEGNTALGWIQYYLGLRICRTI